MIAILGGLGAAVSWAIATLSSSRSSRLIGPSSVLAWVMIVGFIVSIPLSLVSLGEGSTISAAQVAGMIVNGVAYTSGLLLAYKALVIGRVSIVTPIVSTEGGVSALASVVLGETLGIPTAVVLGLIAIGVILASIDRRADEVAEAAAAGGPFDPDDPASAVPAPTAPEPAVRPLHRREDPAATRQSVILAVAAAVAFSIGLITSARLGDTPISWIIFSSRAVGVLLIAVPLVVRGRLRLSRRALPLVILSGVLEAVGSSVYVIGAHVSPATAVVLSSQFAAIAAVSAFILFKERLARIQVVGVTVIAVGVTALAIIRG
jgi:drug/metabolite transporter (DMT)-like permease